MLNGRAVCRAMASAERAMMDALEAARRPAGGEDPAAATETSVWICPAHEPERRRPPVLTATVGEAVGLQARHAGCNRADRRAVKFGSRQPVLPY